MIKKIIFIIGFVSTMAALVLGVIGVISYWMGKPIDNVGENITVVYFLMGIYIFIMLGWVKDIQYIFKTKKL